MATISVMAITWWRATVEHNCPQIQQGRGFYLLPLMRHWLRSCALNFISDSSADWVLIQELWMWEQLVRSWPWIHGNQQEIPFQNHLFVMKSLMCYWGAERWIFCAFCLFFFPSPAKLTYLATDGSMKFPSSLLFFMKTFLKRVKPQSIQEFKWMHS